MRWMFISLTAIWNTGSDIVLVASWDRSELSSSKEWSRIWSKYLECRWNQPIFSCALLLKKVKSLIQKDKKQHIITKSNNIFIKGGIFWKYLGRWNFKALSWQYFACLTLTKQSKTILMMFLTLSVQWIFQRDAQRDAQRQKCGGSSLLYTHSLYS